MTDPITLSLAAIVATPDDEQRSFQIAQRMRWAIANRSLVVYNGDDETFPVPIYTTMAELYKKFTGSDRFGGWGNAARRVVLIDFSRTADPADLMKKAGFARTTIKAIEPNWLRLKPKDQKGVAIRVEYADDTFSEHIIHNASRPDGWTDDDDYSR